MKLFDHVFLTELVRQLQRAVRRLLFDLCDELESSYPRSTKRLQLPVSLIRLAAAALPMEAYSHWRVVGWIETLNDLVYFVDLHQQARRSEKDADFVEQLYVECQHVWYEHAYEDELFPHGAVCDGRLADRIGRLCRRLAQEIVQQAVLWDPSVTCQWLGETGRRRWRTDCSVAANFDRADRPFTFPVGIDEVVYQAPRTVRHALYRTTRLSLLVTRREIGIAAENLYVPFYHAGPPARWHWRRQAPILLRQTPSGPLTLGPTLVYGGRRLPVRVRRTGPEVAAKIRRALAVIEQAWPTGSQLLWLLTSRIVPLHARGVVSFSYRHQPGLSFINCFDRDALDLVDDLIHENSHHHLNLLLRKYVLYRDGHNEEIFYSPWRRTLRPVRGILHASFTFTMGALLFERLWAWGTERNGRRRWDDAGLTRTDLDRARARCLEEIASVRYSVRDLRHARSRFGWITKTGEELVDELARTVTQVSRRMKDQIAAAARSPYGAELWRHREELQAARRRHGPLLRVS